MTALPNFHSSPLFLEENPWNSFMRRVTSVPWNTYKLAQFWWVSIFASFIKSLHFNQMQLFPSWDTLLASPYHMSLLFTVKFKFYLLCKKCSQVYESIHVFVTPVSLSPFNSYNRYCSFHSFWMTCSMMHPHLIQCARSAQHYTMCRKVVHLEFRTFSQFCCSGRLHLQRKLKSRKCFCSIYK